MSSHATDLESMRNLLLLLLEGAGRVITAPKFWVSVTNANMVGHSAAKFRRWPHRRW